MSHSHANSSSRHAETDRFSVQEIRKTLRASTTDAVFCAIFSSATGGIIMTQFFVNLGATSMDVGMLTSLGVIANVVQPIGAVISENLHSRKLYNVVIYGVSRLLWVFIFIFLVLQEKANLTSLFIIKSILVIMFVTCVLGGLGSPNWSAWMTAVVPKPVRGHYFGQRNSLSHFFVLAFTTIFGFLLTYWPGGQNQSFLIILAIGIVTGICSVLAQLWMIDVSPRAHHTDLKNFHIDMFFKKQFWKPSFVKVLIFLSGWAFAIHISNPYFHLYLLRDLHVGADKLTLYTSVIELICIFILPSIGRRIDQKGYSQIILVGAVIAVVYPLILTFFLNETPWGLYILLPFILFAKSIASFAIDLSLVTMQMSLFPITYQAAYFSIAAAVTGIFAFMGTLVGGAFAERSGSGHQLVSVFILSAFARAIAVGLLALVHSAEKNHKKEEILKI